MTPELLRQLMPLSGARADFYAQAITDAMIEFLIDSPKREAAFLANLCHETGSLAFVEELASGAAYEGRRDLGNTEPGDGKRFKGRGFAQVTGRANYLACGRALGVDLIAAPERLTEPVLAARSAGWFWRSKQFNPLADADKFGSLVHAWNGGYNGLDERIIHWLLMRRVLGL